MPDLLLKSSHLVVKSGHLVLCSSPSSSSCCNIYVNRDVVLEADFTNQAASDTTTAVLEADFSDQAASDTTTVVAQVAYTVSGLTHSQSSTIT